LRVHEVSRVVLAVPTVIDAWRQLALDRAPVVIWPVACSHLKQLAKDRLGTGRHMRAGFLF
jgi:hypothetical protein